MAIAPYRTSTEVLNPLEDFLRPLGLSRTGNMMRPPATDVLETENEIRVIAELPGMRSEDINIDMENNVLTITGEKKEERAEQGTDGRYHLMERRYGRFARSFVLPREVEPVRIQAVFQDGVLTVTIPKSEIAKRRHIDVQSGDGQRQNSGGTNSVEGSTGE